MLVLVLVSAPLLVLVLVLVLGLAVMVEVPIIIISPSSSMTWLAAPQVSLAEEAEAFSARSGSEADNGSGGLRPC